MALITLRHKYHKNPSDMQIMRGYMTKNNK
jgi:hypothetical protein